MRKLVALFLLIVMLVTVFCACKKSPKETETLEETKEVQVDTQEVVVPTKTTKNITSAIDEKDQGWAFWQSF